MKKDFSLKELAFEKYNYIPYNNNFKYYNYSMKPIKPKINNFNNEMNQLSNNEEDFPSKHISVVNFKSFYPKNYKKEDTQLLYTPKDILSNENNKDEINNNKKSKSYNENIKDENENQSISEEILINEEKSQNIEKENIAQEWKKNKKFINERGKKFYIKSIPLPKRKKCQETCYIPRKKLFNFQNKKEEKNYPLLISNQNNNNYDSSKNSVSTLNTSSSSYKEKVKTFDENNLNINQNIEFNYGNIYKNNIKNKFEGILIKNNNNNNLENTEILNVKIKLSNDKIIIFKLRRFDDLFLTIKFFCEINSIDEKFIKPLITKLLCTLNTIYQIINSEISSESIALLKQIKNEMK